MRPHLPETVHVQLPLRHAATRATAIVAGLGICGWLLYVVLCDFLVGALTDDRIPLTVDASAASFITAPFMDDRVGLNPDVLATAAHYLPNSPGLQMRLAEFQAREAEDDWRSAGFHALTAVRLSPHDYRPRLLLAAIQELQDNLPAAEESVRAALQLAPGNLEAHWQLGTLLWRNGKLPESYKEFLAAGSGHPAYFHAALERVWGASAEDADAVGAITPNDAKDRLALANFLLQKSRPLESAAAFRQISPDAMLGDPESGHYLNNLIAAGHIELAHELWGALVGRGGEAISNGGFESDILLDFAQFDWSIHPSDHARISIDSKTVHSGRRSLRVDFIGRETTRLDEEIHQVILLRPGAHYRLHYYLKTENLVAPEGPRVAVSGAASSPAPEGSNDWRKETLEFTASSSALRIGVKQQPRFSYEDPTHGTVWFDDFEIQEIPGH